MAEADQRLSVQQQVLDAAQRLCAGRAGGTFRLGEVVAALPHLDAGTVRTHVGSRCCVNAPSNHAHRWPYFRRLRHGVYRIEPAFRGPAESAAPAARVAEAAPAYAVDAPPAASTIHAVVTTSDGRYVAECLEVAVVTQGGSLDEVVANLREAVALHLEDENPVESGLAPTPRLSVTFETAAGR